MNKDDNNRDCSDCPPPKLLEIEFSMRPRKNSGTFAVGFSTFIARWMVMLTNETVAHKRYGNFEEILASFPGTLPQVARGGGFIAFPRSRASIARSAMSNPMLNHRVTAGLYRYNIAAKASQQGYTPRKGIAYSVVLGNNSAGVHVKATFTDLEFSYNQVPHKPFEFSFELLDNANLASEGGTTILTPSVCRQIEDAHQLLQNHTRLPFHALPNFTDLIG
ncbi:hypothetical protein DL95DRAFT_410982 [Leptodontidium sp. 2 PMI_412]|nr:hypothetical protein DL95DRAFT_410982 [Leptodontidium sp. 2 PMI_412]